ncbi:MAG: T9SS type A sorting domain-containing protein [Bacteroidales bacterium]|nr:T9SS type A sorting domain-containing protein [Bacteroidales bacterium]
MKKFVISILAVVAGMSLVSAQNFTVSANGSKIAKGDTVTVTGAISENGGDLYAYLTITNNTEDTVRIKPTFDLTNVPEGNMVAFCSGNCFPDINDLPVLTIEPGKTLGEGDFDRTDLQYMLVKAIYDTVVVGCFFTDTASKDTMIFSVRYIPTKPGRPNVANENRELVGVSVYPNPADGLFNLNVPARAQVEIFSANGQVVRQMEVGAGQTSLQLNNAGIYFIRVRANGKQAVKRLVVR